ncbi:MAG TPA: serine/threonine-protein kinase [Pyrinomonadaceae bacterium]|jgi:serine/threonine-protein kinase
MDIGDTLNNFELLEILGTGGQGVVYKALDTKLDRLIAIKVFSPDLKWQKRNFERFEREAKLASALDHPNISTIYSLFEYEGYHCIAMQYIEGVNLHDFVQDRPLEIKSALNIVIQVAEAVAAAHKQNIVHRDIKARNVMVNDEGRVTVLDFGLAKLIDDTNQEDYTPTQNSARKSGNGLYDQAPMPLAAPTPDVHLTEHGEPYGTPASSAPEMALGEATDFRTDIFSIGVLLYLLLTGKFPFTARKIDEVRDKIINQEPVPIAGARNADEQIPPRLENAVDRALEKNPEDRFQTAAEMRDELLAVLREVEEGKDEQPSTELSTFLPISPPVYAMLRPFNVPFMLAIAALIAVASVLIFLAVKFWSAR